jgi:cytoskeletal protein CcmA (bactofilin family)
LLLRRRFGSVPDASESLGKAANQHGAALDRPTRSSAARHFSTTDLIVRRGISSMTTLGPSLTVIGDITCQEDMTVHGQVKGPITMTRGSLVVAPTGSTEADLHGVRITVHGKVTGDIVASERLELTGTAVVTGTISAPSLVIQDGATFDGAVDMVAKKKAATPAAPRMALVEPLAKAS